MALFTKTERDTARAVGALSFANPFLPDRIALEEAVLKERFVPLHETWSAHPSLPGENPNIRAIRAEAEALSEKGRAAFSRGKTGDRAEQQIYEDAALYALYYRFEDRFYQDIVKTESGAKSDGRIDYFAPFASDVVHFFHLPGFNSENDLTAPTLFALFFQHRRAFHFIFHRIFGASSAASRLRAAVWESVFTKDMRRYRHAFVTRMQDMATLITGPSGTGKELVAGAIGLSRHIPFDAKKSRFEARFEETFLPLNLSALASTLVESELFGHTKGAFTGAVVDRRGYLENKRPYHTVFLDEIGDVDPALQLKLLRVLQTREFQVVGDNRRRRFEGRIVAATNRDLTRAVEDGSFRADLYYRLCSDHIVTPSLHAQIAEDPEALTTLIQLLSEGIVGAAACEAVTEEVEGWIRKHLGVGYPWPGNIRELEQCIRNIVVHGEYRPLGARETAGPRDRLAAAFLDGTVTADRLLSIYCTLVYHRTGRYQETARRLGVDRRTVKAHIDASLLSSLAESPPSTHG